MWAIFAALAACYWDDVTSWNSETSETSVDPSSYRTEVRESLPPPADQGIAPFAGSLGPPENMVEPVLIGTATLTREGSSGPPFRSADEPPPEPIAYQVRGPNSDAHRSTTEPSDRAQSRRRLE